MAVPPTNNAINSQFPVNVAAGGTGANTLTGILIGDGTNPITADAVTQYNVLVGAASNGITSVAPSTAGQPLISQGAAADPAFGTLPVSGGGTGAVTLTGVLTGNGTSAITASAVTQYNVLVGDASNAVNNVAPSATTGLPLISQGSSANPAFGTAVVAGGGTGATSFTAGQILYGNGTSAISSDADFTWDSTANALYVSPSLTQNKKIVLREVGANDYQFYGLGARSGYMNYMVPASTADHIFQSAIDTTSAAELMRITGDGYVGINEASPAALLSVTGKTALADNADTSFDEYARLVRDSAVGMYDPICKIELGREASGLPNNANTKLQFNMRAGNAVYQIPLILSAYYESGGGGPYTYAQVAESFYVDQDKFGFRTATIPVGGIGRAIVALHGTNNSDTQGPHVQITTTGDDYPLVQLYNLIHDNMSWNFDCYYIPGGTWYSSDSGSNFRIYKESDVFSLDASSGNAQGAAITWANGFALSKTGLIGLGTKSPDNKLTLNGVKSNATTGPHIRIYTDEDNYSNFQLLAYGHDSIHLNFDCYYDGSNYKSCDLGSNFRIGKFSDTLTIYYDSGIAQGSNITWNNGLVLDTSGDVSIPTGALSIDAGFNQDTLRIRDVFNIKVGGNVADVFSNIYTDGGTSTIVVDGYGIDQEFDPINGEYTILGTDSSLLAGATGFTLNTYMKIIHGGKVFFPGVYDDTVTSARDLQIQSDGQIGYVSSAARYKNNINTIEDVSWLYELRPVTFEYRLRGEDGTLLEETDGEKQYGFIAEEMEQIITDFIIYDSNNEVSSIHYSRMTAVLVKAIQDLKQEIETLKNAE